MDNCIICNSNNFINILHDKQVPASVSSPPAGKKEVYGSLNIVACKNCSHIFNKDFSTEVINQLYAEDYSASLPLSPNIQNRFKNVAENVIGTQHFKGKTVIEVGASDFTFSRNLIGYGAKKVIAIEPSALFTNDDPNIIHIHDYATEEHIKKYFPSADTVVMRHVMEHVTDPVRIIRDFARSLPINAHFYVEVPNAEDIILKQRSYDFFYEHVSYFSPPILGQILQSYGFETVKTEMLINGQHFGILARKVQEPKILEDRLSHIKPNKAVLDGIEPFKKSIAEFDRDFRSWMDQYNNVAIYGAGGHTTSATARLGLTYKDIKCLFDQSPIKVGKKAPLSHIPIVRPTEESVQEMDCIIIIASLHQDEIANDLRNKWHYKGGLVGTYPTIKQL